MSEENIEPTTAPESSPLLKPRTPYQLVECDSALAKATADIISCNAPLAVDAERASGFKYGQRAYLLQVGIENKAIYLVDPNSAQNSGLRTCMKRASTISSMSASLM